MLYSSCADSPVLKASPHCQSKSAATELIAVVCQDASELQRLVGSYSSRRHGLPAFLQAWPWAVCLLTVCEKLKPDGAGAGYGIDIVEPPNPWNLEAWLLQMAHYQADSGIFMRKGSQYELVAAKWPFSPSITKLVSLVLGKEPVVVEALAPTVLIVLVGDVRKEVTADRLFSRWARVWNTRAI